MFLQIGVRFCRVDRVDSAEGGREAGADSARQVCQPGDPGPAHRQRQGPRCLCHSGQATPSSLTCTIFLLYLHLFGLFSSFSPLIRYRYLSAHPCPQPPSPLSRIGSVLLSCSRCQIRNSILWTQLSFFLPIPTVADPDYENLEAVLQSLFKDKWS